MHRHIQLMASEHRFFIQDITGEWGQDSAMWLGEAPELEVFESEANDDDAGELGEELEDLPPSGLFVFRGFDGASVATAARDLGDTVFVSDELDLMAGRSGWEENPLREIVHRGRHSRNADGEIGTLHLMGAARRPQNLHTDITDLADQVFIFRCQGVRTLDRLKLDSYLPDDESWEVIRALPDFHFFHWPSNLYFSTPPISAPTQEDRPKLRVVSG